MRLEAWQLAYIAFPGLILIHLFVAPYTKVEESFNMQAIHDILAYGLPTSNIHFKFKALFDHMTFPGAVPRTFIGALLLSGLSKPLIWIANLSDIGKQSCVRAVLGLLNASALLAFASQVRRAYGRTTAFWYTFFQASQFHIIYYASRTLPNTFAFCMSTFALSALIRVPTSHLGPVKRTRLGLYLLTIATVIFRSELALLLGSHGLWTLYKNSNRIPGVFRTVFIPSIVPGALVGLVLTVGIDTYFWQSSQWLWPEMSAFVSNVIPSGNGLGASAWGTSPWHWYFTSALPRLMMNQILLLPLCFIMLNTTQRPQIFEVILPSLLYMVLYSFLSHKETRFIFPVIPSLTLGTAITASWLSNRMTRNIFARLISLFMIFSTVVTAITSHFILLPISASNYPGGRALRELHLYHHSLPCSQRPYSGPVLKPTINVHLTNLALQSGVTRFLENPGGDDACATKEARDDQPLIIPGSPDGRYSELTLAPKPTHSDRASHRKTKSLSASWMYDKSSNDTLFLEADFWSQFHYVIVEDPARAIGAWEIVKEISGLGRLRILKAHEDRGLQYFKNYDLDDYIMYYPSAQALLDELYGFEVANAMYRIYAIFYDIIREGYFTHGISLTKGWWIDWRPVAKLYILKSSHSGVVPNEASSSSGFQSSVEDKMKRETRPGLPAAEASGMKGNKPMNFDALGPLVVNKDGTLSRLENWQDMTEQEQKRTVEYLKKRNQIRMDDHENAADVVVQ